VENIFSLVRYPKAGLTLGGVHGRRLPGRLPEGHPRYRGDAREIKNALAGYGNASKVQGPGGYKKGARRRTGQILSRCRRARRGFDGFLQELPGKNDILP